MTTSLPPYPRTRPDIRGGILRHIFEQSGLSLADRRELLRLHGLYEVDIASEGGTIPLATYLAIFESLAVHLRQPTLGLKLARRMGPDMAGAPGYLFLGAPDLGAAIDDFAPAVFAIQDATVLSFSRHPIPIMTYHIVDQTLTPRRQDAEFSLAYLHQMICLFIGGPYAPADVLFEHERQAPLSDYERYFGCAVHFGQGRNSIILHPSDPGLKARKHDPQLTSLLRHHLSIQARPDEGDMRTSDRVDVALSMMIGTDGVSISNVATRLGTREHTLRRRLRAEGVSFRDLLIKQRVLMAMRLLEDTSLSVLEISERVQYADPAAFARAFKARTGKSPSAYRKQVRSIRSM
jgi:AraC-like DNA-binding protein